MKRYIRVLPSFLILITANALPVYGAAIGKLLFFQVIYLYWMESFFLIFFDNIRIASARGKKVPDLNVLMNMKNVFTNLKVGAEEHWNLFKRFRLILSTSIIKTAVLLFYMIFIVALVAFQLTGMNHFNDIWNTVFFRNPYFNYSLMAFLINATVQLIGGFFFSGNYLTDSPRLYTIPFDGRTIMIHVMIIGSVLIHTFIFEGKSYASTGEIVYIGLFMLAKTIMDIRHLSQRLSTNPDRFIMI